MRAAVAKISSATPPSRPLDGCDSSSTYTVTESAKRTSFTLPDS
jgi:hypothetical protein